MVDITHLFFLSPDQVHGWLSRWHRDIFFIGYQNYTSIQQYVISRWATFAGEIELCNRIITERIGLAEAERILREEIPRGHWTKTELQTALHEATYAKFDSNHKLRQMLCKTNPMKLIEANSGDFECGIGFDMFSQLKDSPDKWKGLNLYGLTLERVRDELRSNL